jgi:hypothetical protein
MTYGGPGQGYPQQQPPGWQPRQGQPYPPPGRPQPLTLPGWGAIPAVLGAVLAIVGMFALDWVADAGFSDINDAFQQYTGNSDALGGDGKWIKFYFPTGALIALALAAVPPLFWTLGSFRSAESIRKRGGVTRKSLSEGNLGPTRIFLSVLAAVPLVYHVVTMIIFTDGGDFFGELGPGPWLVMVGTLLCAVGAAIGPRQPAPPHR